MKHDLRNELNAVLNQNIKKELREIEYFKIYSFLYYIVLALKIDSKNFALTLVKVSKRGYGWLAWVGYPQEYRGIYVNKNYMNYTVI